MNERYEIRGLIARGGEGTVHLGWDRLMKREVAIKRAGSASAEQALLNEADVLKRIQHPNVITLLDAGRDKEGAFIVMALVLGKTLEEMVTHCPLDDAEFEQLVKQTMEAVIAAHAKNVVHLDLKPQNIMIEKEPDGRMHVTLLDFGVARTLPSDDATGTDPAAQAMGSLPFMAPERFDREPGDAKADLYSLGCVYYYALTGRYPFHGDTSPQVMVAHLLHQFTPLADIRPDLPAFIPCWVEWLIRRKPADRPADAVTALAGFRQCWIQE